MAEHKDRIRVHIQGKEFNVVGGDFQNMLAAVKQINGRRFVSDLKAWQLPGAVEEVQHQLELSGYALEGGAPAETSPGPTPAAKSGGDRIRIMVEGQQVTVVGGVFQDMLAAVKNLPGRRFDGDARIWEIPGELAVVKGMIQAAGFDLEGASHLRQTPVPPMELPQLKPTSIANDEEDLFEDEPFPFEPPDWANMPPPEYPDEATPPDDDFDDLAVPFNAPPAPGKPASTTPKPAPQSAKPGGDRIRIRVGGIPLVVTGGSFQEMLAAIKNVPGRRFDSQDKVWDIPDDLTIAEVSQRINAAGFAVERN